jgi:integrase
MVPIAELVARGRVMDETVQGLKPKPIRKAKVELESRSFKDGAIYLFRRADYKKPTWSCRVKVPNSKGNVTRTTQTTDEHQAFAFALKLYNDTFLKVANGQDIHSKRVSVTITEYADRLSATVPIKSTTKTRIQFLKRTIEFFGTMRLKEITAGTVVDLNEWMRVHSRNGRLATNTVNRYSADFKAFLNWCLDRSYLDTLPRFPKQKTETNRRPHFDNKDWATLTRHLREFVKAKNRDVVRDRTMLVNYVLILANTGIRVGEARELKWRDLREIPASKGSNQAPDVALFVTGKTGPREVVARTSDVTTYFKRILELRTGELGKPPGNDDYVFCGLNGNPIGSFKKSFTSLLKSAGVEEDSHGAKRTIYSLRHTYATFRLQEGVHQFLLAKNMGTSTTMLEKHYGHTSNVASAAELTKGGKFKGGKKAKAVDWLLG